MLARSDIELACRNMQEDQVLRKYQIKQETGLRNRAVSLVARYCGFDSNSEEFARRRGLDSEEQLAAKEKARKKIFLRSEGMLKLAWSHRCIEDGDTFKIVDWKPKPQETEEDARIVQYLERDLTATFLALQPAIIRRTEIERRMDLNAELNFAAMRDFIEATKGFGWHGLAVIIGEAGDLSNYPGVFPEGHPRAGEQRPARHGPGCLNARFGLHLMKGFERNALSTFRKWGGLGLSENEAKLFWRAAGYNPRRLGQLMGVVGAPLLNAKRKNKYGPIYTARRAHTLVTHPEWHFDKNGKLKPVNPSTGFPPSEHADVDAGRICIKQFLEDLSHEWWRVIAKRNDVS